MVKLMITANDALYTRALGKLDNDDFLLRATNVLEGFKLATRAGIDQIIIDMNLHASDTLLETLHTRPETAHIEVCVVKSGGTLPLELRRLCTEILEVEKL